MKRDNILCIDTTSEYCSVSLFENQTLIENNNSKIERSHSKLLINLVDDILINNNLKIMDTASISLAKENKIGPLKAKLVAHTLPTAYTWSATLVRP